MAGFLGTRASFLSDLLLLSLVILTPAFLFGFTLARKHRGAGHRLVMLGTYAVVVTFVLIYIWHNLTEGFPPLKGNIFSIFNLGYFVIGTTHSALAVAALIMGGNQLYTGYGFTGQNTGWAMSKHDRAVHSRRGKRTLLVLAFTALTGIAFYLWVFVSELPDAIRMSIL